MEKLTFKTNIKCSGCVAQVTPFLNSMENIKEWEVDTQDPAKLLTVVSDGADAAQIKETLAKAGYNAEKVG